MGDRRLYHDARKLNIRFDVAELAHTKQLLNSFCIVYIA